MKTRKVLVSLLICLLVVSLMVVGCSKSAPAPAPAPSAPAAPAAPAVIEMKMSYPTPEASYTGQVYNYYAKALEEESKGTIKVKVFPSASLVSDTDVLDAVQKGNVDIGHFMVSYVSPTIKELSPFEIDGAYRGDKFKEMEKAVRPVMNKILDKYSIKYLAPIDQSSTTFVGRKKLIKTPADMKGLKIRVAGKWGGESIKAWGGAPVTIPLGDLPTALERGTVDGVYVGWVITGPFKLYETAKFISYTTIQATFGALMMSGKTYAKLNDAQKAAVDKASQRMVDFSADLSNKEKQKYMDIMKNTKGVTVYTLTDAENKAWTDKSAPLMEQVKAISGPLGEELIAAFKTIK